MKNAQKAVATSADGDPSYTILSAMIDQASPLQAPCLGDVKMTANTDKLSYSRIASHSIA